MSWSAVTETSFGSTGVKYFAIQHTDTLFVFFYDGAGNVKVQKSVDGGNSFAAAVTITSALTNGDVMLNDPVAYDPSTGANGRLFCCYGKNVNDAANRAILAAKYSDDLGATWSAEQVLDDGTSHGFNNAFYRVGAFAYAGRFTVFYSYESFSTFTTDGIWLATASWAGAAAPTYNAKSLYSGTGGQYEPNIAGFANGTVICSWYDDGTNTNQSGDLYITRSTDFGATWSGSVAKLTTTTDYGRPRIQAENGTWWIVANKPWNKEGSSIFAGVTTLTSTDDGVTWGAPIQRIAPGATWSRDHPDLCIQGQFVGIICRATAAASTGHAFIFSTDGGSTWSGETDPFGGVATTSSAPFLIISRNYLNAAGNDTITAKRMLTRNPQWFTVMPQAQTGVLDDTTRANENPLSDGGQWTTGVETATALKLLSDGIQRTQASGTFRRDGSRWSALSVDSSASPLEIWLTLLQKPAGATPGEVDVWGWDPVGLRGYSWVVGVQGGAVTLSRLGTVLATVSPVVSSGDLFCLQVWPDRVVGWQQPSGSGVWNLLAVSTDTTYRPVLNPALEIAANADTTPARLSSFGGGQLSVPANTAAPTIAGAVMAGSVLSVSSSGAWTNSPVRWAYQWQTSPDGITWTNVANAILPFFTVADQTKRHRCQVTVFNAVGASATQSSGALLPPASGGTGFVRSHAFTPRFTRYATPVG